MAEQPLVGVIMGSRSDWDTMRHAADTLAALELPHEVRVVSAHRTPDLLFSYAAEAEGRGLEVLIAGAGGAAHLPGMCAAKTALPVLGVPVESKALSGMDSLLSIVQMPAGVPVGTLAIGRAGAINAALLAAAIVARGRPELAARLAAWRRERTEAVLADPDPRLDPPGVTRTVAVLGGGQLARMLALAAVPLGLHVRVLDPAPDACAAAVAEHVVGAWDDPAALDRLAAGAEVVTCEFENVPAAAAAHFAGRLPVRPGARSLATAQDRLAEKQLFDRLGIGVPAYAPVDGPGELEAALARTGLPAVVKTRRQGYDGKGQVVVHDAAAAASAVATLGGADLIVEALVPFHRELSVLVARRPDGEAVAYPAIENVHRGGILRVSRAPAEGVPTAAAEAALAVAAALDHVGVLALELFQAGDRILANELAPRVHNSGHLTIEGAATSQFEQHLRAVLGLPLGSVRISRPAAMVNLIGALPPLDDLLAVPGAHVHLYGKAPRPGRKVGHVTLVGDAVAGLDRLQALI